MRNDNVRYGIATIAIGGAVTLLGLLGGDAVGVGLLVAFVGLASVAWGLLSSRADADS